MKNLHLTAILASFVLLLSACQTHEHVVYVAAEEAAESPAQLVSQSTRSAATALLAALTDEQKKLVVHDIKAPLRKDWHFVPRQRQGLMLGDMTAEQKTLVHQLMQTALSDSGYLKATDIIWLETVLYEMSNQSPGRDPGKYVLQIFGDPTNDKAAWGWRIEGHHLSINLTYTPEAFSMMPLFFGTNPAVVQQGPLAGKRVLADAHNLAVKLASSMDDEQRKKMLLDKKPRDVISGPGREKSLKEFVGIKIDDLDSWQHEIADQLMTNILDNYQYLHTYEIIDGWFGGGGRGPKQIYFSWAGPVDGSEPFYYRIHGPYYLIEYSCQGRNHVHFVIHDLTDPLQDDLLKKHFEQHEH